MKGILMEEVFRLLEEATCLQKSGEHRIEAATKYYESCYLMRQIVGSAAGSRTSPTSDNGNDNDNDDKTFGPSTCHLLEAKIDHYTKIARKLYFDEATVAGGLQSPSYQQQKGKSEQREQPATSVIIGLLDDAISVITESQMSTLTTSGPVPENEGGFTTRSRTVPNPTAPVDSSEIHKPIINMIKNRRIPSIWNQKNPGQHKRQQQEQYIKKQQQQRQPYRWRHAVAAIERRILERANRAHSRLSKAVDLDERHANEGSRARTETIATYVEASELYLSAIQLGETQKTKLQAATKKNRGSFRSSNAVVETMGDCQNALLIRLKRVLVSALDRVEALKKEEEEQKYRKKQSLQQNLRYQASTVASSIRAMPIAANISRSFHRLPVHQSFLFSRQNHNNNGGDKKGEANRRSNSPTTVAW